MSWHALLELNYRLESARCVARFQHNGPLRILQSLYPEGDAICHNVVVHPPGGLVGGDTLEIRVDVGPGAHGLITTPGAARFYRSESAPACQRNQLVLQAGARLEWLPQETIAYSGCIAENHTRLTLAPGAELLGWDVTALGLPQADQPFLQGHFLQHTELPGVWLERGRIAASDTRLLNSPLGLAGQRCVAMLYFATGSAMPRAHRERVLELARDVISAHPLRATASATAPNAQVVVVRVLAPMVEPAIALLKVVRNAWRVGLWQLSATPPRIWNL